MSQASTTEIVTHKEHACSKYDHGRLPIFNDKSRGRRTCLDLSSRAPTGIPCATRGVVTRESHHLVRDRHTGLRSMPFECSCIPSTNRESNDESERVVSPAKGLPQLHTKSKTRRPATTTVCVMHDTVLCYWPFIFSRCYPQRRGVSQRQTRERNRRARGARRVHTTQLLRDELDMANPIELDDDEVEDDVGSEVDIEEERPLESNKGSFDKTHDAMEGDGVSLNDPVVIC